ncbi:MAG: EAL and HDOD domain-containing protein [Peptoanaerobacter stomatis]|uniref:EAL and HDOD domain-containing protein n=1 Tax=Peptoanaerobacter stomatis TaxID=796937 RepID=UPI003FA07F00
MDTLFARQPIFTVDNKVVAYELLYRNTKQDDQSTNFEKTIDVLINANTLFSNFDVEMASKRIFLNFDRKLLLDNIIDILSPREHVIEILESVVPDKIIINRIQQLKKLGFSIALDDYTINYPYEEFVDVADYIKVDFIENSVKEIIELSRREKFKKKILLAEKVENENMHNLAVRLNYKLFQGYHYAKPIVHKGNHISINVKTCLDILLMLNKPEVAANGEKFVDLYKIAKHIERDPVLSFKMIQITNGVRANLYVKIDSVLRAVTLLGYASLHKWLKILLFQEASTRSKGNNKENVNKEVIKSIIVRTAFVENVLSKNPRLKDILGEAVLGAMVDLFDILFEMPMEDIVSSLDLSKEIMEALMYDKGDLAKILHLVKSYESGDWDEVKNICDELNLNYSYISDLYVKSLDDSKEVLEELSKEEYA